MIIYFYWCKYQKRGEESRVINAGFDNNNKKKKDLQEFERYCLIR